MGYVDPHTLQRYREKNKTPEVETITDKKYWVVVDGKGKLVYHREGHLLIFPNKKIAVQWFKRNDKTCTSLSWRLERLTLCIIRD